MITALYILAAPFVVGAAAAAAERSLRASGRPGRVPWLVAPLLSIGLVLLAATGRGVLPVSVPPVSGAGPATGPFAEIPGILWVTLSAVLLALVVCDALRMRVRSRGWLDARVAGVRVQISESTGPATLGVLRVRIVMPRWVFSLSRDERRLVLLHELEHARAGDVRCLAGMMALLILVPWHPALWWQGRRLQRALELDCDTRVVRRSGDRARYARLLLAFGERARRPPLLAAALGVRRPLLERRLEALLVPAPRHGRRLAACTAAALAAVACIAPAPTAPEEAVGEFHAVELPAASGVIRERGGPTATAEYQFEVRELPAGASGRPSGGVIRRMDTPRR